MGYMMQFATPEESFSYRTKWEGECLVWTGATTGRGYGRIVVRGRLMMAHRFAWVMRYGVMPEGKEIHHTCYNTLCCNVEHLQLASRSQNMAARRAPATPGRSGVRNVHKRGGRWVVRIKVNGKHQTFGSFDTVEEAAPVAERVRREIFGDFATDGTLDK